MRLAVPDTLETASRVILGSTGIMTLGVPLQGAISSGGVGQPQGKGYAT